MANEKQDIDLIAHIKNAMQSCNMNFLLGSGLSRPYLITLGNIELLLQALSQDIGIDAIIEKIIRASLYKRYFEEVMLKNCNIYVPTDIDKKNYDTVIENYNNFLKSLNNILLHRDNTLLNKQINLFTTNIDLFLEKSLEYNNLEFNDGFKGRIKPIFALSNFRRTYLKTSLHYENKAELPVFNLFKLHGSINWAREEGDGPCIYLSTLSEIKDVVDTLAKIDSNLFIEIEDQDSLDILKEKAGKVDSELDRNNINYFLEAYLKLQIVNPTKEKFQSTVLNNIYYEQLRLYANELEKENSILFVMGFSFADEHIREITLRVANSNPTLKIYVLAFSEEAGEDIKSNINIAGNSNNNIQIISPEIYKVEKLKANGEKIEFDFNMMNKCLFEDISKSVNRKQD